MPLLINKNGEQIGHNDWSLYDKNTLDLGVLSHGKWILPLALFLELKDSDKDIEMARFAVSLNSDDVIEPLAKLASELPLIVLNFQAFADGRSFSQARILREQYDFAGELRAVGHFIQDQLFYLSRCGVDVFEFTEDVDVDSIRTSLADFSDSYQAACDESQPLFRRRV